LPKEENVVSHFGQKTDGGGWKLDDLSLRINTDNVRSSFGDFLSEILFKK
jgi:hypothetical protein